MLEDIRIALWAACPREQTPLLSPKLAGGFAGVAAPDYLQMILSARVYDVCLETPLTCVRCLCPRFPSLVGRMDCLESCSRARGAARSCQGLVQNHKKTPFNLGKPKRRRFGV